MLERRRAKLGCFLRSSRAAKCRILNLELHGRAAKTMEITMHQAGPFNPAFDAERFGLKDLKSISYNFEAPRLVENAIRQGLTEASAPRSPPR